MAEKLVDARDMTPGEYQTAKAAAIGEAARVRLRAADANDLAAVVARHAKIVTAAK